MKREAPSELIAVAEYRVVDRLSAAAPLYDWSLPLHRKAVHTSELDGTVLAGLIEFESAAAAERSG
jgi:hypothetical protein